MSSLVIGGAAWMLPKERVSPEKVITELLEVASLSPEPEVEPAPASPAPRRRDAYNVVLITIDTLRYDLGYAGHPKPITPNLDALAARSTVYERGYATASYTPKSLGPLLIGLYGSETYRDGEHYTTFYPANVFVAERARAAGVRTFAAMTHHYFKWNTGINQGFDVWDTSALPPQMKDNDSSVTSERLTDVALDLMTRPENVQSRFFAWFHYLDPHAAYVAHEGAPDFAAMAAPGDPPSRSVYEKDVWYTDRHVGRLIEAISNAPFAAETAIIVTADHGEAFGEKGHWKHGRELWEAIVRVPLIVFVPGAPPRRVAERRSHIDIAPTVVDMLGLPTPEDGSLRGTSLLNDVFAPEGTPIQERDVLLDMPEGPYNEARRALLFGTSPGAKLIDFAGRFELYDLAADPQESRNLTSDRDRLSEALSRYRKLRAALREQPANPPVRPLDAGND